MTEDEEQAALALLRALDTQLDELTAELRGVQRSMTMAQFRLDALEAALAVRTGRPLPLPDDDAPER
jgi:hypothetical protein